MTGRPVVLVVDDEVDNLLFYRRVLEPICEVVEAGSGEEGFEKVASHAVRPSAVVSDQRLPGITGVDMLTRLQRIIPATPKIVVTAYSDVQPILLALNACNLYGYLLKPVQPAELRGVVARALDENVQVQALGADVGRLAAENERLRQGNVELRQASERMTVSKQEVEQTLGALREAYSKISELALRDELTQVQNRRAFVLALESEYSRCRRYGRLASLMLFDVDKFKLINDTHGHPLGDKVLRGIGVALREGLRTNDQAFRLGGDEFAVLLPETDASSAHAVVGKLRSRIAEVVKRDAQIDIGVSIGIECLSDERVSCGDDWYALADAALYKAKRMRDA